MRAVGARRGDRSRRRRVRSRARVRRAPSRARSSAIFPALQDRARAHHDARGGGVRRDARRRNVAATITPHHLLYSRNALFAGGIRPHHYCLPVLKREAHRRGAGGGRDVGQSEILPRHRHRAARAARQGERMRPRRLLHGAGRAAALRRSVRGRRRARQARRLREHYGADFYGLPRNTDKVTLEREPWTVPADYPFGDDRVVPLRAGETLSLARRVRGPRSGRRAARATLRRRSQPDRRCPGQPGERKVRAPQSRMPGNARPQ